MAKSKAARRAHAGAPAGDDVRVLAREAAIAAVAKLAELANSDDERIALAASQELLNRAFGKIPAGGSEDQSVAARPLVIRIVRFGTEDNDPGEDHPGTAKKERGA